MDPPFFKCFIKVWRSGCKDEPVNFNALPMHIKSKVRVVSCIKQSTCRLIKPLMLNLIRLQQIAKVLSKKFFIVIPSKYSACNNFVISQLVSYLICQCTIEDTFSIKCLSFTSCTSVKEIINKFFMTT